jgi:hypothetical protein
MATGRLGASDLSAATNTSLYTCPSDTFAVISVSLCNRANQACNIRMAVANAATPTNAEWIEFDTELLGKGVLERTGIVMDAGKILVVYSNQANVSAVAFGLETSTI